MFQCLIRHAGKGQRDGVKRLYKLNEYQQIVETHVDRQSIERELKNTTQFIFSKHNTQ